MNLQSIINRVTEGRTLHGVCRGKTATYDNMGNVLACIEAIGKQFTDRFTIDDDNRWAYKQFAKWVAGDPTMQAQDTAGNIVTGDICKGIYINGRTGSGKSLAMAVMALFAEVDSPTIYAGGDFRLLRWQPRTTAAQIWDEVATGADALRKYTNMPILCIQDLGAEPEGEAVYMGARRLPLRQLIEARGDRNDLVTLFTSNYAPDDERITRLYGERVASRLRAMCNILTISGKDRRI